MTRQPSDDEPLLQGLRSPPDWPEAPAPRELYDALLQRTSSLVRRRASMRRLRQIAAVALAYAAGLATMRAVWTANPPPEAPRQLAQAPRSSGRSAATSATAPPAEPDLASLSAAELRRLVPGAPRARQIRLLQLAGDRYLCGAADVASALDCYRQVLELTPPDELGRAGPRDSWLLAELKLSAAVVP